MNLYQICDLSVNKTIPIKKYFGNHAKSVSKPVCAYLTIDINGIFTPKIAPMTNSSTDITLHLKGDEKNSVFETVEGYISRLKLKITSKDANRPWGGFFVLDEDQAELFGKLFFPDVKLSDLYISGKLSPKLLLVQPSKRLSWQYHHRRAEIWRVVSGKVGVVTSATDIEDKTVELNAGETIRLAQGQRHRLVGLNQWGVIAEIWQHTDAKHPSDEEDIVRVQDDFGR